MAVVTLCNLSTSSSSLNKSVYV